MTLFYVALIVLALIFVQGVGLYLIMRRQQGSADAPKDDTVSSCSRTSSRA